MEVVKSGRVKVFPMPTTELPDVAKTKRNDTAVKVDSQVVYEARIVASYLDITLAEYLSRILRPLVSKDLEKAQQGKLKPVESDREPGK